jgi:putative transposase
VNKDEKLGIKRQCELLEVCRSSFYYIPQQEGFDNQELMKLIDKQYMETPFTGTGAPSQSEADTPFVPVDGFACPWATS